MRASHRSFARATVAGIALGFALTGSHGLGASDEMPEAPAFEEFTNWVCWGNETMGYCEGEWDGSSPYMYYRNYGFNDPCSDSNISAVAAWGGYGVGVHCNRCCSVTQDGEVLGTDHWGPYWGDSWDVCAGGESPDPS